MSNYLARYQSGECQAVCRELAHQGAEVYSPSILPDATGVASEIVDRSYRNLCHLLKRLNGLGYLFQHPEDALVEASPKDVAAIETIESSMGRLPLLARKWYERIKSVDFSQLETQLFTKNDSLGSPVSGLGLHTPLVFLSLPKCLSLQEQIRSQAASIGDDLSDFKQFLPLGAWASNSNPKGFMLPSPAFDAEFFNDGAGPIYFVEDLRNAFQWGGFPRWRLLLSGKKQAHPLRHIPAFETILPILRDGLKPI
jgi:hypothetical protein